MTRLYSIPSFKNIVHYQEYEAVYEDIQIRDMALYNSLRLLVTAACL